MEYGNITSHIDVALVVLYTFWLFFAGLIYYLHRENKREGYPLISDRSAHITVQGYPDIPAPKTFNLTHGGTAVAPRMGEVERPLAAAPAGLWPGAPLVPTGDAMIDGVGPASWVMRADVPDMTFDDNMPKIVPLRVAAGFAPASDDTDPRGLPVFGADGIQAGTVRDLWVDKSEYIFRYYEVTVGLRNVLVPDMLVRLDKKRGTVHVASVLAAHFATAPLTANPDQVTLREEDQIVGYFGGGQMYATVSRAEPLL